MLLGRERELARIRSVITAAEAGRTEVLVLAGDPGIGKTALLDASARNAAGMRTLRTTGVPTESGIGFVGLADLLTPVFKYRTQLAPPQRAALERALAAGQTPPPPVGDNRLALRLATLALLGAAAEETPILVIVDDAQSVDQESLDTLAFAARRLTADRIGFLFAVRLPPGGPRQIDSHAASLAGLPSLYVDGLDQATSEALLTEAAPDLTSRLLRDAVLATAAGNPLALREIPRLLRSGNDAVPTGPLPVGEAVQRSIAPVLAQLNARSRLALLVAAASADPQWSDVAAALAHLGLSFDDLQPAEAAALIHLGAAPGFRHPLVRAAVYHKAPAADRRAAHQALAAAATGARAIESRANHLAAAATGPDPSVAAALADAGHSARDRGAWQTAMNAFTRAARFALDPDVRLSHLLSAAEAGLLVGASDVADLAAEVIATTPDPFVLARAQRILATWWNAVGDAQRAADLLIASAERMDRLDPELGVLLRLDATVAALHCGDNDLAKTVAGQAITRSEHLGGDLLLAARTARGWVRFCRAESDPAEPLGASLAQIAARIPHGPGVLPYVVLALPWLDQHDLARKVLIRMRSDASLPPDLLLFARIVEIELAFRTGRWAAGIATAEETVRLAGDLGHHNIRARVLTQLALFEAARGQADSCARHVREANAIAQSSGLLPVESFSALALGLLAISARDYASAEAHLQFVRTNVEKSELRHPGIVPWAADLIEALYRIGDWDAARQLLAEHEDRVRRTGCRSAEIGVARCRIILGQPVDDGDQRVAAAVEQLGYTSPVPAPFEQARLLLAYGERLRMAGQRTEARRPLHQAKLIFDRLGATPWAERSAAELRAAGGRVTPRDESIADQLSAQELQVAREVVRGARNREVAAALFLSPKTVERHLSSIYRKLGIRSRSELVARMLGIDGTTDAL